MITLIFGDSITYGAFDSKNGGWAEMLKRDGFRHENFVYNLGISGNTSQDILNRIEREILTRKEEGEELRIILAFGINDSALKNKRSWVPEDKFIKNTINILNIANAHAYSNEEVFCVGLTNVDESKSTPVSWDKDLFYFNVDINLYNNILRSMCNKQSVKFIDIDDLSNENLLDGVHPTAEGHKKIYQQIKNTIK